MIQIGIDPGMTGAIALLNTVEQDVITWDMPTLKARNGKAHTNIPALAALLREAAILRRHYPNSPTLKLEAVHAMPRQGVTSSFNFGEGFGAIKGVLATLGLPYELVTPQKWKKAAGLIGSHKDYARSKALQLYPDADLARKKDIGRADAILIARYG